MSNHHPKEDAGRNYGVYPSWPGISEQIAETVRRCPVCVQDRHEPLIPSEFPERPWQKVALDLFKLNGKWFMVLMDYCSRYPEVTELTLLTAAAVINRCQSFFARHGVPEEVRSDCGSQFKELEKSEFHKFAKEYGFIHGTSSPRYPQSNGFAEAAVKTVKTLKKTNEDPYKALLEYRATPLSNGYSPAELLFGRRIRTTLPMNPKRLVPEKVDTSDLKKREEKRREEMS
jgi:transposase InsO family protein